MSNLAYKKDNIIQFPKLEVLHGEGASKKTDSLYKSNGVKKATPAEPIRDPKDIKKMCDYFKKTSMRNYTIFVLGITLGIRGSDLIKLKIEDVLGDRIELIEKKTKKRNSPILTPKTKEIVNEYLNSKSNWTPSDYLFVSSRPSKKALEEGPQHITIQTLNNIIKKAAKECEVKGHISSHSLRKTFAYQLLQIYEYNDEARFALQSMLNHSDMRTTMAYAGLLTDQQDSMRRSLEKLF